MAYSKKKCKGNCGKYPKLGYDGYCYSCAPEAVKEKVKAQTRSQRKRARQRLQNKVLALKEKPDENKLMLELWYLARRYEMTGYCEECGASTCKNDDKYYRWSICHIVPKGLVPEVATHHLNFIELCQIHHQEYDAGFERAKRMGVFRLIQLKFQKFKLLIPEEKHKWINPYLFQMETVSNPIGANNQKQDNKD